MARYGEQRRARPHSLQMVEGKQQHSPGPGKASAAGKGPTTQTLDSALGQEIPRHAGSCVCLVGGEDNVCWGGEGEMAYPAIPRVSEKDLQTQALYIHSEHPPQSPCAGPVSVANTGNIHSGLQVPDV